MQSDCIKGRGVCETAYGDVHYKDLLWSIERVRYCIRGFISSATWHSMSKKYVLITSFVPCIWFVHTLRVMGILTQWNKALNVTSWSWVYYYSAFQTLGSRHIHKEIKLQKAMNGVDKILCKTDLILIRRLTYKYNTFNHVDFETFSKSAYVPFWYLQFQSKLVSGGVVSFYLITSIFTYSCLSWIYLISYRCSFGHKFLLSAVYRSWQPQSWALGLFPL